MTIGLSLPFGYLNGADETGDAKCFSEAFGKPCDCLAEMRDHGVSSIEIRGFGPDAAPDGLLGAARSILGSGMQLSLHGYLIGNSAGYRFGDIYPELYPMRWGTQDTVRDGILHSILYLRKILNARQDPMSADRESVESGARD